MPRSRLFLALLLILVAGRAPAGKEDSSILRFHPGSGAEPRICVRGDRLNPNDFGVPSARAGGEWDLADTSALADVFCAADPRLRRQFKKDLGHYGAEGFFFTQYAGNRDASDPTLELSTYRKPYELHQAEFLAWLEKNTGRTDFLSASSRKASDWRGNLVYPLVRPDQLRDEALLKRTFGQLAAATSDSVTLVTDNRFNPLRWIAPVNETHHHEQAAWGCLVRSTPEGLKASEAALMGFWEGRRSRRLLMEYDLEIEVEDYREAMGERSLFDTFARDSLSTGTRTLVERCYYNPWFYSQPANPPMPLASKGWMKQWLATRFEPINIQIGLMFNWCEDGVAYRLNELMVAEKNQRSSFYYPEKPGAPGFIPTANEKVNPAIVDGGTAESHGWGRMPIDVLRKDLYHGDEKKFPAIRKGGEVFQIPDGNSRKRLRGVIDVTNFYTLARRHQILGGQRGYWSNAWYGFDGDVPQFRRPDERHALYWLGLVYETHGPFRVQVKVNRLNAWIEDAK